jgi:rhodanese-related sulfurtransferase
MDMKVASTIGYERRHQELLSIEDEDEFVARATASLGPQPPNFENIVALNQGPLRSAISVAPAVAPGQLALHLRSGALVVDVRTELQFDEAHISGSVCLTTLRAGFGSKLAWLADPGTSVLIVGRDDQDAREAVALAAAVGVTNIAGYLAGGMTSWREEQRNIQQTERLTITDLHGRWEREDGKLQVLDVRERSEWDAGHIPGSIHQPYHDIADIPDDIDPAEPVAVVCGSGQRAAVAASLLQRYGADHVIHVVQGGVPRWKREGWPVDEPTATID